MRKLQLFHLHVFNHLRIQLVRTKMSLLLSYNLLFALKLIGTKYHVRRFMLYKTIFISI